MSRYRGKNALGLILTIAMTGPAIAQEQFSGLDFKTLDQNSDGFIDAPEASTIPGLMKALLDYDYNRDGRIDEKEFDAFAEVQDPPDKGG